MPLSNQFPEFLYTLSNGQLVPVASIIVGPGGALIITPISGGGGPGGTSSLPLTNAGAGVNTALALPVNAPGAVEINLLNPNSVVICFGDSTTAGFPVVNLNGTGGATSYAGPGMTYPQYLSSLPQFAGIAVYDYGVGGDVASSLPALANGTASLYQGTKYVNGAVVGSYSGVTAVPSTLVPSGGSGGTAYVITSYGINDSVNHSVQLTSYITSMQSGWTNIHAWGSNVKVISCTPTAIAASSGTIPNRALFYQYITWLRCSYGLAQTNYADDIADVNAQLGINQSAVVAGATTNGYFFNNLHPNGAGYAIWAQVVANRILSPQASIPTAGQGDINLGNKFAMIWLFNFGAFDSATIAWGPDVDSIELCTLSGFPITFGSRSSGTFTEAGRFSANRNFLVGTTTDPSGSGSIIATGNVAADGTGKGFQTKEGSNCKQGTGTLALGTLAVANTSVTASSRIFIQALEVNSSTALGSLRVVSKTAGTGFTVTSLGTTGLTVVGDLSNFAYEIFEPAA